MDHEINPFQELYVTDSADPNVFVRLFSDVPVRHSQFLFKPGNVIIKGSQGSGKSMLLNLFRPRIRVAYHESGIEFPVPLQLRRFIGAGINLTRSGALDFGQRPLGGRQSDEEGLFPLYFGDFLNYFIVRDIVESLSVMVQHSTAFDSLVNCAQLDAFATLLSQAPCWFGALGEVTRFADLCTALDIRIAGYRRFHNANAELPDVIHSTKTTIGEPIAQTAECLRAAGVVSDDVPIFIRIDQVERLYRSDVIRKSLGAQYRRVINKALGTRDLRVSYRIGTRRYAWEDDLTVYSTLDKLENIRDFRIIDMDYMLRRAEDTKTWIFPEFAEDAFSRRLQHCGYLKSNTDMIRSVFGASVDPGEYARQYARNSSADRILRLDNFWPEDWKSYLRGLFERDPLESMLACAWAQQGKKGEGRRKLPPPVDERPWNRTYWRKERIRQCLGQIAARAAQRLKWAGKDQILALSAGNITIFLSVSHEIWEAFLRSERRKKPEERTDPIQGKTPIHPDIQSLGIRSSSDDWYQKVTEQPKGDDRQAFVNVLGSLFRGWLLDDVSMSYPGHNGFSISEDALRPYTELANFLRETVDYGDLCDALHTTKSKDRRKRTKWYLSPILSPHFQIPESHVKEPYYAEDIKEVLGWLSKAGIMLEGASSLKNVTGHESFPASKKRKDDCRQGELEFREDVIE